MMIRSNFHTHTIYCDGKNTPAEMVKVAMGNGFTHLGFSGHSYLEVDRAFAMDDADQQKYWDEVQALKEQYRDKLTIFCGLEQDCYSEPPKLA